MYSQITYTEPVLCHYNHDLKKSWFVYFDITETATGKTIRKQVRGGINYWKTKDDRVREGNALAATWSQQLKKGYNPFGETVPKIEKVTLEQALTFGLDKCKVSKSTRANYRSTINFIKKGAQLLKLSNTPVAEIKRLHIKLILEKCQEHYNWSNTSYNKHLGFLKAVLTRVEQWEVIETNPCLKIGRLPVAETEKFIPYTELEKRAIQEHLFIHHYRFFVYLMSLYQTGIRPKELLSLKIKDVDLINMQITIIPDLTAENSKTKKIRKVPISKHLLPFLRELNLPAYDKACYVFGSPYEPGKGNKGSAKGKLTGANHPDYFKPSFTMIKRDTVTRLWKVIVKDGLGIDKYLYAAKHTGGNDKILAGIDLDSLRELYGHSSKLMTEKYAKEIKKVRFNEIINKSPAF